MTREKKSKSALTYFAMTCKRDWWTDPPAAPAHRTSDPLAEVNWAEQQQQVMMMMMMMSGDGGGCWMVAA